MDMKLELVILPVTDADRAKAFYVDQVGFVCDHDETVSPDLRFIQLTPPGSACSIAIGRGVTDVEPGTVKGLMRVVDDVAKAREVLEGRGVEVSEIGHEAWGDFVDFPDPDGNLWTLQQLPAT